MPDSSGTIVDEQGFKPEKLAVLMDVKNHPCGRVSDYAAHTGTTFEAGQRPWHVPVDVAPPCATRNKLDAEDAARPIRNDPKCVAEGANIAGFVKVADAMLAQGVI